MLIDKMDVYMRCQLLITEVTLNISGHMLSDTVQPQPKAKLFQKLIHNIFSVKFMHCRLH